MRSGSTASPSSASPAAALCRRHRGVRWRIASHSSRSSVRSVDRRLSWCIRMSNLHRLIFTKMGGSPAACAAFLVLGTCAMGAGRPYRALMQRVAPSDRRCWRAGREGQSSGGAREGLRPGIEGARQDLRLFCAPWGLPLADIDVPAVVWQGSDDTIVPPEPLIISPRRCPTAGSTSSRVAALLGVRQLSACSPPCR